VLAALVFVTLTTVYSFTYVGLFNSGDEHLFVSGAQSLGLWGELNTSQVYSIRGIDRFVEPGQAIIGAVLYQLTRLRGVGGVHVLFLTNIYVTALTGVAVFWLALHHGFHRAVAVGAALIYGLGTMAWPHTKYYFRDPLAAMFVAFAALSFELAFARRSLAGQAAQWTITLILLGCGILSKDTAAVAAPVFLTAAVVRAAADRAEGRSALIGLGIAAAAFGLALIAPWSQSFARFEPIRYLNVFFALWRDPLNKRFGEAVAGILISPGKSLFVESPVLLLALAAPLAGARQRHWLKLLPPFLMTFGLTLVVARLKDYLWWGGVGWGVRHMLPALPLLAVACAPVLQALVDTRSLWRRLAAGGLVLLSGMVQLAAATVGTSHYYDRIGAIVPNAAWTIAIWNPLYSEVVGVWQLFLEGRWWSPAWVRLFPTRQWQVIILLCALGALLTIGLALLSLALRRAPRRGLGLVTTGLVLAAVSLAPYGLLRVYYPDPFYFADRADFRAAAEYLAQNVRPGDAVVVRGYDHPLWYFLLNYGRVPAPWYAIAAPAPDETLVETLRANQTPSSGLAPPTVLLFRRILPARYQRVWVVNDLNAPGGDLNLEEWWLSKIYAPVRSDLLALDKGRVQVSLFAFSSPTQGVYSPTDLQFGDAIRLTGFALLPYAGTEYHRGGILPVSLTWQAARTPADDLNIGVYLLDSAGRLSAQQDSFAVAGFYSTTVWKPGETIVDNHGLTLPADLSPGAYTLAVALYDWQTGARLPLAGPSGPVPDDLAYLAAVSIK